MKKVLIIIFGLFVVLCLSAILIWNILPKIVSHKLSECSGVSVNVSDIQLSYNKIIVNGIRVGNPSEYSKISRALFVDDIVIHFPFTRFFNKKIMIDDMTMNNVYIGLEFESPVSKKGNWTTIMNHVNHTTKKEADKKKIKSQATSVLIKHLLITDLKIELAYKTGGQPNKTLRPIDRIELTNISNEGGISTAQIMNVIMQEILKNIFLKEGIQNMLEDMLNPKNSKKGVMSTLKGLFSGVILFDHNREDFNFKEFEKSQ